MLPKGSQRTVFIDKFIIRVQIIHVQIIIQVPVPLKIFLPLVKYLQSHLILKVIWQTQLLFRTFPKFKHSGGLKDGKIKPNHSESIL